jgi:hypothetical protein
MRTVVMYTLLWCNGALVHSRRQQSLDQLLPTLPTLPVPPALHPLLILLRPALEERYQREGELWKSAATDSWWCRAIHLGCSRTNAPPKNHASSKETADVK